jgi:nucleotide-binding universal stress UspA family protein
MIAKRILVPTDFSTCSKLALGLAISLANGCRETDITLLHVVEPTVPSFDEELGVLEPQALRTELEMLSATRDHDVQIDAMVEYGEPGEAILKVAKDHDIDLIVMGTHGRNGLVQFLVGSTAETVMRTATCPVMTVRDDSVIPSQESNAV